MPPRPNVTPSQFGDPELTAEEAYAACGPAAAVAFARANGRNPTLAEALALAREVGWTAEGGMNGVANQKALLDRLGVEATLDGAASRESVVRALNEGRHVTISTPGHYFVATDYDPETDKFYVGNSGTAYKKGAPWMSLTEMEAIGGRMQAALYSAPLQTETSAAPAASPQSAGGNAMERPDPNEIISQRDTTVYINTQTNKRSATEQEGFKPVIRTRVVRANGKVEYWERRTDQSADFGVKIDLDVDEAQQGVWKQRMADYEAAAREARARGGDLSEFQVVPGSDGRTIYNPRTGQTISLPKEDTTTRGGELGGFRRVDAQGRDADASGQPPVKLYNPTTGQTIDLPDVKDAAKPSAVTFNGNLYAWDGKNLTPLLQGQKEPRASSVVGGTADTDSRWIIVLDGAGNLTYKNNPNYVDSKAKLDEYSAKLEWQQQNGFVLTKKDETELELLKQAAISQHQHNLNLQSTITSNNLQRQRDFEAFEREKPYKDAALAQQQRQERRLGAQSQAEALYKQGEAGQAALKFGTEAGVAPNAAILRMAFSPMRQAFAIMQQMRDEGLADPSWIPTPAAPTPTALPSAPLPTLGASPTAPAPSLVLPSAPPPSPQGMVQDEWDRLAAPLPGRGGGRFTP